MEKSRARRRRDVLRMKNRAKFVILHVWQRKNFTLSFLGKSTSMHCTHPCKMCKWYKHDGTNSRPFSEQRMTIDGIDNDTNS